MPNKQTCLNITETFQLEVKENKSVCGKEKEENELFTDEEEEMKGRRVI